MAEPQLLQERLISGKGVLKIPTDVRKVRTITLYSDLIRPASNKYTNVNYNPPRGRLGTVVFLRNNYVIGETPIEYDRQSFDGVNDIAGQTMIAVKCAYAGTLTSFNRLATAIGLTVLPETDLIKDYENLQLSWTEARITCYADVALQLRLFGTDYDTCNEDNNKTQPPPPPPPPRPRVLPKTPITILSQPYDRDTNDDGNTQPFEGDLPRPDLDDLPTKTFTVKTYGLRTGCLQGEVQFTATYTAKEIDFETRIVPSGEFAGCEYDFLIVDRVSRYPSTDGGSFPGVQIVTSSP